MQSKFEDKLNLANVILSLFGNKGNSKNETMLA